MKYSDFYDKYKHGLKLEYRGLVVGWASGHLFTAFDKKTGVYYQFNAFQDDDAAIEVIPHGATHRHKFNKKLYKVDNDVIRIHGRFGHWVRTNWKITELSYFEPLI